MIFGHRINSGNLDVAHLLRAEVVVIIIIIIIRRKRRSKAVVVEAIGEERPSKVHGSGGEGPTADAEEQSHDDTEDVLGAVSERAQVVGGQPQRHDVVVDLLVVVIGGF